MTSAATLKHQAIEDAITAAFNAEDDALPGRWAVYESVVDAPSLPACVLDMGSPYREPTTLGTFDANGERLRLVAHLLVGRNVDKPEFLANEAADRVMAAVDAVQGYSTAWTAMHPPRLASVNGLDAWDFTLDLDVV